MLTAIGLEISLLSSSELSDDFVFKPWCNSRHVAKFGFQIKSSTTHG